jgi:hypothetical protein
MKTLFFFFFNLVFPNLYFFTKANAQEWKTKDLIPLMTSDSLPVHGTYLDDGIELPERLIDKSGDTLRAFQWTIPVYDDVNNAKYSIKLTLYAGRKKDTVTLLMPNAKAPGKPLLRRRLHTNTLHYEVPIPYAGIEKYRHRLHWTYIAAADTIKTIWAPNIKLDHAQKVRIRLPQFNGWMIRAFTKDNSGYLSGTSVFRFFADKKWDRYTTISPIDTYLTGDTMVVQNTFYRLQYSDDIIHLIPLPASSVRPIGGRLGYKISLPDFVRYGQGDTISYPSLSYRYFVHVWCVECYLSFQPMQEMNRLAENMLKKHNTKWLHVADHYDSVLLRKTLLDVPLNGDIWGLFHPKYTRSWSWQLGLRLNPSWYWLNREGVIVWKGEGKNDFEVWEQYILGKK